jgi:hypothetical protein
MDSKWQSISTGRGAVAVPEHAPVHLGAEAPHFSAFIGCRELTGLMIQRFDLLGDLEVFVGDGLVDRHAEVVLDLLAFTHRASPSATGSSSAPARKLNATKPFVPQGRRLARSQGAVLEMGRDPSICPPPGRFVGIPSKTLAES